MDKIIVVMPKLDPQPRYARMLGKVFIGAWIRLSDIGLGVQLLKGGVIFWLLCLQVAIIWDSPEPRP